MNLPQLEKRVEMLEAQSRNRSCVSESIVATILMMCESLLTHLPGYIEAMCGENCVIGVRGKNGGRSVVHSCLLVAVDENGIEVELNPGEEDLVRIPLSDLLAISIDKSAQP